MKPTDQKKTSARVICASFAMIMFFVTALFGIIFQVDPFIISIRATCSAIVIGFAARVVLLFLDVTLKNQRH